MLSAFVIALANKITSKLKKNLIPSTNVANECVVRSFEPNHLCKHTVVDLPLNLVFGKPL